MKSIANQYRDLKEGKMTQANFMRNLRMSMPQFVTNTTSFNDAVRILKNKSILTETNINELSPATRKAAHAAAQQDMDNKSAEGDYLGKLRRAKQVSTFGRQVDPAMKKKLDSLFSDTDYRVVVEKSPSMMFLSLYKGGSNTLAAEVHIIRNRYDLKQPQPIYDEAVLNKLYTAIKYIQNSGELDDLDEVYDGPSEPMGNEDLGDYYEIVAEELESLAKSEYNLDNAEIEQMFETEWHSGKNDNFIEKCYKDGDEPSSVAANILEDYMQMEDNIASQIDRMEDEESGKYTKFQDFPGGISESKKKKKAKKEEKPYNPNAIHPSELRMGIRVEMEHTDDPKKAEKIALDHLAENPYYYTALKLSGVESPSAPKAKPVAPKKIKKKDATEMVDQANQMQKVKLMKEALEKLVRKVLSEMYDGRDNLDAKNEGFEYTGDKIIMTDDIKDTILDDSELQNFITPKSFVRNKNGQTILWIDWMEPEQFDKLANFLGIKY